MIPKIIHYCWFGKNPKPALALKCIDSWRKYCPDYEIREWNEDNYDVSFCKYSRQAYENRKWAFVSDIARYKILYEHGGVYFDTDVELVKPIDFLLKEHGFMGFQTANLGLYGDDLQTHWLLNPGLGMGAEKFNSVLKDLLDEYDNRSFVNEDNTLNLETICETSSRYFYKHGMKSEDVHQHISGFHLYPKEFFNPMDHSTGRIYLSKETVSIHHYAASWASGKGKRNVKISRMLRNVFGEKVTGIVKKIYRFVKKQK